MVLGFIEGIVILATKWRFSITSWGRTEKHNQDVGGVPNSYHLLWLGVNIVMDDNERNINFESDCSRLGIIALWEGDHYHLQRKGV